MKRFAIPILIVALSLLFHAKHLFIPPFNGYEWRQWDTFAVIRNFTQEGMNFFTPRTNQIYSNTHQPDERLFLLDVPLYSYAVALLGTQFGLTFQTARALNITLAALTSLLVYIYVRKLAYPREVAIAAALLLNLSPLFQFSAASVQPDMLMLMLLVSMLLLLTHTPTKYTWLSLCTLILVTLIKPYNYLILFPLLVHVARTSKEKLFFFHIILPPLLYLLWFTSYGSSSPSEIYWWGRQTWSLSIPNIWHYDLPIIASQTLQKLATKVLTIPIVALTLLSLCITKKRHTYAPLWFYIAGFGIFFFLFLPGNFVHVYYQLPLLPAVSILCVLTIYDGVQLLRKRWKENHPFGIITGGALLILGLSSSFTTSLSLYTELFDQHAMYAILGSWPFTQTVIAQDKTVMLYQKEASPVLLNMMDRNGWVDTYYPLDCSQEAERLQRISADYIVIFRLYHDKPHDMKMLDDTGLTTCLTSLSLSPVYENTYIRVYQKSSPSHNDTKLVQ